MKTDNPNDYRTTKYGARWYCDPLPTCDVADATDDKWPAVTTLKGAWRQEFRKRHGEEVFNLDALRVALFADDNWQRLSDHPDRVAVMARSAAADLNAAADRGTAVHSMIEEFTTGQGVLWAGETAQEYADTCRRLVAEMQMTILLSEVVVIRRATDDCCGWGGTVDAIVSIGDKNYVIDWKSRGADSSHSAYEGESTQCGAYALGDYAIVSTPDGDKRVPLPELHGGLIVSIKPDDYAVFPIDLQHARTAALDLAACWDTKRHGTAAGRKAIGKQIDVSSLTGIEPERNKRTGVVPLSAAIKAQKTAVTTPAPPDEGDNLGPDARDRAIKGAKAILTDEQMLTLASWHDLGWTMAGSGKQTQRRWLIAGAAARLLALAWTDDGPDDDMVRALLAAALNDDGIRQPAVKIGAALGQMTIAEAERLRQLIIASHDIDMAPAIDDHGSWQVSSAALASAS